MAQENKLTSLDTQKTKAILEMGLNYSSTNKKAMNVVTDNSRNVSLFFSDFFLMFKQKCHNRNSFAKNIKDQNLPFGYDTETMETIVHLWFVNGLHAAKWQRLKESLKNRLMRDFLDTLYCTSQAFDELFLLLFANAKSRCFIMGRNNQIGMSSEELQMIVEDILKFSSVCELKYFHIVNGQTQVENLVDFPLKTFSLCPCTRRPLYVAMYLSRPDIVYLLLKNGARIPYEDVCICTAALHHPLKNVMDVIRVHFDGVTDSNIHRRERNAMSLKLLLIDLSHYSHLWNEVWELYQELSGNPATDIIPSLKHICRAEIRQKIRESRHLCQPSAWDNLKLPNILIAYINIDEQFRSCMGENI
ncbi:hypothetical protein X975_10419, partial [Stegodyphus mimosarum]